jgi:hypothetical protein
MSAPPGVKPDPAPPPDKAHAPHAYWFLDGRQMAVALDGGTWWSLMVLDGYARTRLAGAVAPTEASWGGPGRARHGLLTRWRTSGLGVGPWWGLHRRCLCSGVAALADPP